MWRFCLIHNNTRRSADRRVLLVIELLNLPQIVPQALPHRGRAEDLRLVPEAEEPGVKLRAHRHRGREEEVVLPVRRLDMLPPEAVDHRAGEASRKAHPHGLRRAAEHAEDLLGIGRHVHRGKGLLALADLRAGGDALHLVDPVVPQLPALLIPAEQIVVLVVPHERKGTHAVPVAPVPVEPGPVGRVIKITEADAPVPRDGAGELVHIIIDALVHRFDPVVDIDLALQELSLVYTRKAFDLADQAQGLALGDELHLLFPVVLLL